tara:strand:- start:425 stop:634 length:210 start_codon:yes stop_codon:yes gene_type:complete
MEYNLVKHGDKLLQIIRDFNITYFVTEPDGKEMNKELLGMWVNYLECDSVVKRDTKILICKTVEEAQII